MTEKAVKLFVTMRCLMIRKDENCTPALGPVPRLEEHARPRLISEEQKFASSRLSNLAADRRPRSSSK
jgi:hypothetical protein